MPARKATERRIERLERLARERRAAAAESLSPVRARVLDALSEDDKWRVLEMHDAVRANRATAAEAAALWCEVAVPAALAIIHGGTATPAEVEELYLDVIMPAARAAGVEIDDDE